MSFADSYAFMDAWVVAALRALGVDAFYAPLNDITSSTGKIGGAAQARRGAAVLHHATIACELDTDLMTRVLRIGREKLSDKGIVSAAKRVSPLRQQTDLPRDTIIARLVASFADRYGLTPDTLRPTRRPRPSGASRRNSARGSGRISCREGDCSSPPGPLSIARRSRYGQGFPAMERGR